MQKQHFDHEIQFLHGLADRRPDGSAIPGEAFGIGARLDSLYLPCALRAKDYHFTITIDTDGMDLVVDTYSAINAPFADVAWNDDAWEEGKLHLRAAGHSRAAYRMLCQTARAVLAGRDVYSARTCELVAAGISRKGA